MLLRLQMMWLLLATLMMATSLADEEYTAPAVRVKRAVPAASANVESPPVMKIVTVQHVPYVNITQTSGSYLFSGFLPELIQKLCGILNVTCNFYASPGNRYGYKMDNGSWNGMIGELMKKTYDKDGKPNNTNDSNQGADMAAAALTITSARAEVVDFLHPFDHLGLMVVIQKHYMKQNYTIDWPFDFGIFKPIAPAVWGLVSLTVVAVGLVLSLINRFNPYEWGGRYNLGLASTHHKDSFNFSGSLWFVFSTLQWQGFERAPRSISAKVLTCFWFCFVTITLVTYTGGLVNNLWWSSMAQQQNPLKHPIGSLEELVYESEGQDFKVGCVVNGSTYRYITGPGAEQKTAFKHLKYYWETELGKAQLVPSVADGLKKIRNENYAFIMESMEAKWQMNQMPCDLTVIGNQFATKSYGLALPQNSPYQAGFNQALLNLIENGELDEMEERWWDQQSQCWNYTVVEKVMEKATGIYIREAKPKVITLKMFWGPLVGMVIGVIFSLVVALVEILYYRYKGRYQESNRPQGQTLKLDNEDGAI